MARKAATGGKQRYCICRKTNTTGLMVACEGCDEWYHYKCIGIKQAPERDYFCDSCLNKARCANPGCLRESSEPSAYCSWECELEFNELRYLKSFSSNGNILLSNPWSSKVDKLDNLEKLETERDRVVNLIRKLKEEKDKLEQTIKSIQQRAKKIGSED